MNLTTIAAALLFSLSSFLLQVQSEDALPKRPNILFIIADDQSPLDLKIYNP